MKRIVSYLVSKKQKSGEIRHRNFYKGNKHAFWGGVSDYTLPLEPIIEENLLAIRRYGILLVINIIVVVSVVCSILYVVLYNITLILDTRSRKMWPRDRERRLQYKLFTAPVLALVSRIVTEDG